MKGRGTTLSNSRLRDLVDRQNRLWNRMQEIQRVSEDEKRDWTAEERTNWDAAEVELRQVSEDIERLERSQKLSEVDRSQLVSASEPVKRDEDAEAQKYERAFGRYMRGGLEKLTLDERSLLLANTGDEIRAQATTSGSVGGFLIPPGYRTVMTESLKAYGGLINHANVITTSTGNPLQWPSNDDTANTGAILAENAQITSLDVALGTKSLGAYMYTSRLVLVSLQLLQDSAFDLDTWLPRKLGERLGRAEAAHFISGTGTGQPEGAATNATASVPGAVGFGITYDNLIDLEHSVDPAYRARGNARFLFNDATLAVIRKVKDADNRPIWLPVPVPGMPATINGVPYTIDQGMASPGANAKSILFGDFEAGYIIRQVLDMQMVRLTERYMDFLQVGFFGFMRLDAKPDNTAAYKAFQHGAT